MAKTKKPTTTEKSVVIQDLSINIRQIDRSRMDLQRWRNAMVSAESIIQPTRRLLYDAYADAILDEHLTSVMEQRMLSVTNTDLVFEKDGEIVQPIQDIIDTEAFEELIKLTLESKAYGYSLMMADFTHPEPIVELVPRAHVIPTRTLVVSEPYSVDGIDYSEPPYTNLYLAVGKPKDLGLLLKATPLVIIKRGNVSDWATFNELFGQPLRKGTYNPNDPGMKEALLEALNAVGASASIAIPEGTNIEFVTSYQTAAADTYQKLWEIVDKGLSKLFVGQTMTTEDGASKSQGEVHERVANKISESDRKFVLKTLNKKVKAMMLAQGLPADGAFRFVDPEEQLSKKDKLEGDLKIHQAVGALTKEYYMNEYHVQFVDETDPTIPDPAQEPESEPILEQEVEEQEGNPVEKEEPKETKLAGSGIRGLFETVRSFFFPAPTR